MTIKLDDKPKIEDWIRDFIPPLTQEESAILEADIIANGCREPIRLSCPGNLVIDGHHRFDICEKHGIEYKAELVDLTDGKKRNTRYPAGIDSTEDRIKWWMLTNQLGRRNLKGDDLTLAIGRLYNMRKKANGGRADRTFSDGKNCHPKTTAQEIASETGKSERTVRNAAKLAALVDEGKSVEEAKEAMKPKETETHATYSTKSADLMERIKAIRSELAAMDDTPAVKLARSFAKMKEENRTEALELIDRFVQIEAGPEK